jgi:hypothetical protein
VNRIKALIPASLFARIKSSMSPPADEGDAILYYGRKKNWYAVLGVKRWGLKKSDVKAAYRRVNIS